MHAILDTSIQGIFAKESLLCDLGIHALVLVGTVFETRPFSKAKYFVVYAEFPMGLKFE